MKEDRLKNIYCALALSTIAVVLPWTALAEPASTPAAPAESASSDNTPTENGDAASATKPTEPESSGILETTRRSLYATTLWLARGVDGWFGEKPFEQGGRVSGQLSTAALKRERESVDYSLRFSARVRLPNLEERTYLFLGSDNERDEVTDTPGAVARQEQLETETSDDRSFFGGIGLLLRNQLDLRIGFRGPLKPYAQARYRKPWQLGESDLVEFRQTAFWTRSDRFGATSSLTYEHRFTRTFAARWLNTATISQQSEKFEWTSVAGLYEDFGQRRSLSVEGLVKGKHGDPVRVSDYGVQLRTELPVYKDWLIAEVLLGHFWPRRDLSTPRDSTWTFGAGLKMLF